MAAKRIYFTVDDPQGLELPQFAVRQTGETPLDAVLRSIAAKNDLELVLPEGVRRAVHHGSGWRQDFVDQRTGETRTLTVSLAGESLNEDAFTMTPVPQEVEPVQPAAMKADEYEPPAPEEPRKTLLRPSPTGWKTW